VRPAGLTVPPAAGWAPYPGRRPIPADLAHRHGPPLALAAGRTGRL